MISFNKLKPALLEEMTEGEIVKCLKELSQAFTQSRHKIDDVYASPKHISSYASFYLPTNMYKMAFLLKQLPNELIEGIKNSTVVEVGTGPGTYLFGLLEELNCEMTSFIGVDHSPLMLKQAEKIHQSLYPCSDITWRSDIPKLPGRKTYIFGNSLNEMGHYTGLKLVNRNKADIVICIEPGTKSSFKEMSSFRSGMIKDGYKVIYPCSGEGECPIIKLDEDDWCHQVVRTKLDDSIERLSQLIKLDRKTMPAIIHVYTKDKVVNNRKYQVVRLVKNIKHAFLWEVCFEVAGEMKLVRIELMKKLYKKKEVKALESMSTGYEIDFTIDKKIDSNHWRVKLTPEVLEKIVNKK